VEREGERSGDEGEEVMEEESEESVSLCEREERESQ